MGTCDASVQPFAATTTMTISQLSSDLLAFIWLPLKIGAQGLTAISISVQLMTPTQG